MQNPDDWIVIDRGQRLYLAHAASGYVIWRGWLEPRPGEDLAVIWRGDLVAEDEVLPEAKEILLMYAFAGDQSGQT